MRVKAIRREEARHVITAAQMRAARALLGIDQRQMAELSGLSVPTIQRMEASDGVIRGNVDSLMRLISALEDAGIELNNVGAESAAGGRGVRLKEPLPKSKTYRVKSPRTPAGRAE
jgi:transcriptional regulator with XRE-family HTH domain